MKISYNWLKEYINIDLEPAAVAEILTDTGLEVEGVEEIETIKGGLKGVVIGEVLTREQHPNADRLSKTTVNVGGDTPLEIVCGAPNVDAGQKVVVATVGTTIYMEDGEFKIKKSKIRGEVSEGMICAEDELGLGQSHDGIMVLPAEAKVGTPAAEYFNIESDFVFEIGLTPNRTDAMSHYGVARDLRAALVRQGQESVDLSLPSITSFSVTAKDFPVNITIEDTDACPRYAGVSLKNVKVGPSPDWMQNKLRAIGIGPINNVVDITNYVLHETGHPLHAFDADKLNGNIVVKHLPTGSKFTTLDDKERELNENDLMICNDKEAVAIAGVMGGKDSGVSDSTVNVFIEAAYFNSVSVRKTAKRQTLSTDASFRYERGVDPEMTLYALQRAAILMRDLCGGEISMDIKDNYPTAIKPVEVEINLDRINTLIGQEIEPHMVRKILNALDIQIKSDSGKTLLLSVPTYRADVTREADIVEEILRIYGFNAIDIDHKMHISVAQTDPKSEARYREKVSAALSARGFNEIMNNSLTKTSYFSGNGFNEEESVAMLNPLSQDLGVMRQNLVFGGLETVARNANRQRPNLSLYEFGKVYSKVDDKYNEQQRLAIFKTGNQQEEVWKAPAGKTDFYYLKAEVEFMLNMLGFSGWAEQEVQNPLFDFALGIFINKQEVITIGKINAKVAKMADVKQEVFYADINWEYLAKKAKKNTILFQELPKYPEVRRDLALLLDKNVNYSDLKESAERTEKKILRSVNLFDVYEGKNLPEGKKSYAMSFIMRDDEKTLNDKQVDKVMEKILGSFKHKFGAELR